LCYHEVAIPAPLKNIVRLGSVYPLQLFVPPLLLILTFAYSLSSAIRTGTTATTAGSRPRCLDGADVVIDGMGLQGAKGLPGVVQAEQN